MIEHVEIKFMLTIPLIKDMTPKAFHIVVVIKDVLDYWESLLFNVLYFCFGIDQTLCYDFLQK